MRRRQVFVSFYDRGNLGDDLLARALMERYPRAAFNYLGGDGPARAFSDERNARPWMVLRYIDALLRRLHVPGRVSRRGRRALISRSQYTIRIGGSIFMERGPWWLALADDRELLASRDGLFVLNTNFGPWESDGFLTQYEQLLGRARDVTVRDESSLDALAALGNVRRAPDLLFATRRPPEPAAGVGVLVSVIDLSDRDELADQRDAYEAAIAELVEDLVDAGRQVTLMSFCSYEGDAAAADRIQRRLEARTRAKVGRNDYDGDVPAALATLAGAEVVVATRFHAMVLGLAFERPVACLAYSGKMTQALEDLGLGRFGLTIAAFTERDRRARLEWVLAAGGTLPAQVRADALGHFSALDQYLGSPEHRP